MSVKTKEAVRNMVNDEASKIADSFVSKEQYMRALEFGDEIGLPPSKMLEISRTTIGKHGWAPEVIEIGKKFGMPDEEILKYLRASIVSYCTHGWIGESVHLAEEYGERYGLPKSEVLDLVEVWVKFTLERHWYENAAINMEGHGLPRERVIDSVKGKLALAITNEKNKDVKKIRKAFKITEDEMREAATKAIDIIFAELQTSTYWQERAIRIIERYGLDKDLLKDIKKLIELKELRREEKL